MTLRKSLLLGGLALALIAYLPASALANPLSWKDKGVVLKKGEHATVDLSGKITWELLGPTHSYTCDVTGTLTAEGGTTTGTITKFALTTASCVGTGAFAQCSVKTDKINGLPWVVHTTTTDLELTNVAAFVEYQGAECLAQTSNLTFATVTATPNKLDPIASLTISAKGANGTLLTGSLSLSDPNTLGIG